MLLTEWLVKNTEPSLLLSEDKWSDRSVFLEEVDPNGRMEIKVDYVWRSTIVIDYDKEGQVGFFRKRGEESFDQRSDYLLLDELDDEYRATFIELKKNKERHESGGEVQLRWSLPYLEYLIAVYKTDNYTTYKRKDLKVRYFRISSPPSKRRGSPKTRTREHFISRHYQNIVVHYSTRDRFKFKDFLAREPIPALV